MRPLAILILVLGVVFNVYSIEKKHFITTFPFQVYGEFIYMKVKVNGSRDLDFILDTGASGTVINEAIADQLGLKSSHQISVQGVSGFIDGTNLKNSNFKIGNLELKGVTLHKIPLQQLEGHIGRNIDGILGSIIFKNYIVSINYDVGSIKLYDKAGFKYTGNAEPVEIKFINKETTPHVTAEVTFKNGEISKGDFLIDTGAAGTMLLNTHFENGNHLKSKIGNFIANAYIGLSGKGSRCFHGRIEKLNIKKFCFFDVPVALNRVSTESMAGNDRLGLIGNKILKKFNVIFDYDRKQIYLEPNKFFESDFEVGCSGMFIKLSADNLKIIVDRTIENSPAAKAGIREGDEVLRINGQIVANMRLPEIERKLSTPGGRIIVMIKRKTRLKIFAFRMRKLF